MDQSDASQRAKTDALLRDLGADTFVIETISARIDDDAVQSVVTAKVGGGEDQQGVDKKFVEKTNVVETYIDRAASGRQTLYST